MRAHQIMTRPVFTVLPNATILEAANLMLRRMKSPSETMPTSFPAASTTGSPLMFRCSMVVAASTIVVSGVTVMTGRVMI